MLHFPGSEACSHVVHSHVDYKLLVCVQEIAEGIEGLLGDWIEANINNLQLLEHLELVEKLNGAVIGDSTLLKSELLKLVAKRSCSCDHLGSVICN